MLWSPTNDDDGVLRFLEHSNRVTNGSHDDHWQEFVIVGWAILAPNMPFSRRALTW